MREYDEDDLHAAFVAALGPELSNDPIGGELQAPDGLATAIAIELAQGTVDAASPRREQEVTDGATACVCGILVSAWLPPAARQLAARLTDGVATVRSFGRHAVIARQCDLAAVASIETALARELGRGRELAPSALQLFELGLAIGLGARPEPATA